MEEKKQEIIECAWEFFRQYGIKSVSMDDLARQMGMSKKTLYQYISDKNDLVNLVLEHAKAFVEEAFSIFHNKEINAIDQHFRFRQRMEPERLKYQPTLFYDMKKYYPALFQEMRDTKRRIIYSANLANLKLGKQQGFYLKDVDEEVISQLLTSMHLYTFDPSNGFFTEAQISDEKLFAEVYKYHFRGICTELGLKELQQRFCNNEENK